MGNDPLRRATVSPGQAQALAAEHFGVRGLARALPGERDVNFELVADDGARYVLKVAPAGERMEVIDLELAALDYLARSAESAELAQRSLDLDVPRVVMTVDGRDRIVWNTGNGSSHVVRLQTFVHGTVWAKATPHTSELRRDLGRRVGRLAAALDGFSHPAASRAGEPIFRWDLARDPGNAAALERIEGPTRAGEPRRALVERRLAELATLLPRVAQLRQGVLYNDANDWNVLVGGRDSDSEGDGDDAGDQGDDGIADGAPRRVVGFVDFGDMVQGAKVVELAVAIAYGVMGSDDPLAAATEIVAGFHETFPLADDELALLFALVQGRLARSVLNSAVQRDAAPDDPYLTISAAPAWDLLERFDEVHPRLAEYLFRAACGKEPCPESRRVVRWLERHRVELGAVLDPDPRNAKQVVLDLSVGSPLLGAAELSDVRCFMRTIDAAMAEAAAETAANDANGAISAVGIGRYDETRAVYVGAAYGAGAEERRTVHLGLDLFVPAGTPVRAPLAGTIHSFADNARPLDYGPTILLEHRVVDETGRPLVFWTIHGHLARESLRGLAPGQPIAAGAAFARVGDETVNGGWAPHLHLQVIVDLLDAHGDYPGVARPSQRATWLSLSPDPNLIVQLAGEPDRSTTAPPAPDRAGLLAARHRLLGRNLSLAYADPLHFVRGLGQFLYDVDGQPWLDCVNNVPHVGHAHPRVVAAVARQAALVETNTRYLHENVIHLAERLTATLPAPLSVCYFVNSGSEANELALRLVRAATGRRDMAVVEGGYHGNTTTLIDLSSYKHAGPGGGGAPPWVHAIPCPDAYRGRHRGSPTETGRLYAGYLQEAVAAARAAGGLAGFLCESILSCAGQIVLPDGFLREAYRLVRAAGGLCIADEVQTGLGRAGSRFWAFETQGVVPDVVTIGKPLGNGHPLAAVVTTPAIAAAFDNGMEYFNTFGGNPVACAAGLAVLDVIRDEGLQERAREVGGHLLARLRELASRHGPDGPIGDVRGLGLFLGVELVADRDQRTPAPALTRRLVERLKSRRLLLSRDGPGHNVLKIKPPLCFTRADADRLVEELDRALAHRNPLGRRERT